jgi:hypothetical protein
MKRKYIKSGKYAQSNKESNTDTLREHNIKVNGLCSSELLVLSTTLQRANKEQLNSIVNYCIDLLN